MAWDENDHIVLFSMMHSPEAGCIGVHGIVMYSFNCQQLGLLAVNQTLSKSNKVELALLCLGTIPTWKSLYFCHIFLHCAPQACTVETTHGSKNELCDSVLTFYLISIREMIYLSMPESLSLSLSLPFTDQHFFSHISNVINWLEDSTMNTVSFGLISPKHMSKQSDIKQLILNYTITRSHFSCLI